MLVVARQQPCANKIALWCNNATSAEEFGPIGLTAEARIGTSCSKLMEIVEMKKSLLALAVLGAFAGAASAQSSVTLFGVVDLSANQIKNGGASTQTLQSNQLNSNRLGFRGIEDLGGGLKAGFWLEAAMSNEN